MAGSTKKVSKKPAEPMADEVHLRKTNSYRAVCDKRGPIPLDADINNVTCELCLALHKDAGLAFSEDVGGKMLVNVLHELIMRHGADILLNRLRHVFLDMAQDARMDKEVIKEKYHAELARLIEHAEIRLKTGKSHTDDDVWADKGLEP